MVAEVSKDIEHREHFRQLRTYRKLRKLCNLKESAIINNIEETGDNIQHGRNCGQYRTWRKC